MIVLRYWNVVVRRFGLFALLFLSTLACFVYATRPSQVKEYVATTSVLIGPDPKVLPRADALVPASSYWSFQTKMRSLRERPVLRRAAELMRGDRSFSSPSFEEGSIPERIRSIRDHYRRTHPVADVAVETRDLAGRIATRRAKSAQLVSVSVRHSHPASAVLASWAVAEAARQLHAERVLKPARDHLAATRRTLRRIEEELEAARSAVAEERAKHRPGFHPRWVSVRTARQDVTRELDDTIALYESRKLESYEARNALASRRSVAESQEATWLADQLFDARRHLAEIRTQLADPHPEARRASRRVDVLNARLRVVPDEGEVLATDVARAEESLTKYQVIEGRRQVLAMRHADLQREASELGAAVAAVRPFELEVQRLELTRAKYEQLRRRLETAALWKSGPVSPYEIARSAVAIRPPSFPARGVWAVIVPLLVAATGIAARELADARVYTAEYLFDKIGVEPLAVLPFVARSEWTDLQTEIDSTLYPVEAFIECRARSHGLKSLVVTSPRPDEGKTTVATALARGLARRGKRVVFVDADLRSSSPDPMAGLAEWIVDDRTIDPPRTVGEAAVGVIDRPATVAQYVVATADGFDLLPRGGSCVDASLWPHVAHRLTRATIAPLISELKERYEFVIIDTPPVGLFSDALAFAEVSDGSLLVLGAGVSDERAIEATSIRLRDASAPLLGVVLNRA